MLDACANGEQTKCLTVIDEFTRESLAIDVSDSIRSGRVIEVLSRRMSTQNLCSSKRTESEMVISPRAERCFANLLA